MGATLSKREVGRDECPIGVRLRDRGIGLKARPHKGRGFSPGYTQYSDRGLKGRSRVLLSIHACGRPYRAHRCITLYLGLKPQAPCDRAFSPFRLELNLTQMGRLSPIVREDYRSDGLRGRLGTDRPYHRELGFAAVL